MISLKSARLLVPTFCALLFLIISPSYAADEITITTYYPSPNGTYRELSVSNRMAIGNVNISADGRVDAGDMAVFGSNDTGAPGTEILGSLTIASRLGIGTTTPNNLLQVKDLITFSNTTANTRETLLGFNAGHAGVSTSRIENTFIGFQAGQNTRFISAPFNLGSSNTAVGVNALQANISGSSNTAIGANVLMRNDTGRGNSAVGFSALSNNTTGVANNALGFQALENNTSGSHNIAIGSSALQNNTIGEENTAIGTNALQMVTTGSGNIGIGFQAGDNITSGSQNIIIGYDINLSPATGSNQLNIGNLIYGNGLDGTGSTPSTGNVGIGVIPDANFKLKVAGKINATDAIHATKFCFGEGSGSCISGSWPAASSDLALKKNIQPLGTNTLVKLNHLSGVTFEWKDAKDYSSGRQIGLIAQEVEKYYPELVGKDSRGYRTLSYDKFTAVLLEGVKELYSENMILERRIGVLEKRLADKQR